VDSKIPYLFHIWYLIIMIYGIYLIKVIKITAPAEPGTALHDKQIIILFL